MKTNTMIFLLLGATVLMGGTSWAEVQFDGSQLHDGTVQGFVHHGHLADRLLADFDINHDGKITHAEFNSVLGNRFTAATHGAKEMSQQQFLAIHEADFQRHAAERFRQMDWNANGQLTLEEFVAPQRVHFQMMDPDGKGVVQCGSESHSDGPPDTQGKNVRGWHGFAGFGRVVFCNQADISHDGHVTRAEFDAMMAKEFNTATGGKATMTLAQFVESETARYQRVSEKMFNRLDRDGNGKLSLAEFAMSSEKLFGHLDRNRDGFITADEMKFQFHGRRERGRGEDRQDTSGNED